MKICLRVPLDAPGWRINFYFMFWLATDDHETHMWQCTSWPSHILKSPTLSAFLFCSAPPHRDRDNQNRVITEHRKLLLTQGDAWIDILVKYSKKSVNSEKLLNRTRISVGGYLTSHSKYVERISIVKTRNERQRPRTRTDEDKEETF